MNYKLYSFNTASKRALKGDRRSSSKQCSTTTERNCSDIYIYTNYLAQIEMSMYSWTANPTRPARSLRGMCHQNGKMNSDLDRSTGDTYHLQEMTETLAWVLLARKWQPLACHVL